MVLVDVSAIAIIRSRFRPLGRLSLAALVKGNPAAILCVACSLLAKNFAIAMAHKFFVVHASVRLSVAYAMRYHVTRLKRAHKMPPEYLIVSDCYSINAIEIAFGQATAATA